MQSVCNSSLKEVDKIIAILKYSLLGSSKTIALLSNQQASELDTQQYIHKGSSCHHRSTMLASCKD
jgi:hypothetical protein